MSDFDNDDGLDVLIGAGFRRKSPVQIQYIKGGPKDGQIGMVTRKVPNYPEGTPEQRKLEDAFEARAIAMHDAQKPLSPLAEKPKETWGGVKIKRGD